MKNKTELILNIYSIVNLILIIIFYEYALYGAFYAIFHLVYLLSPDLKRFINGLCVADKKHTESK